MIFITCEVIHNKNRGERTNMLIRVKAENFKSFDSVTELSMVSSDKIEGKTNHSVCVNKVKLLKNAVVYGANASGKTNIIEIFNFIQICLRDGLPLETAGFFCKNKESNAEKPSSFEIQFSVGERIFAYGFSAILKSHSIIEEWLYELTDGEKCIFESEKNIVPHLNLADISENERSRFMTYAEDYTAGSTSLFLAELNRNKRYSPKSPLYVFKLVYDWLTDGMKVYRTNEHVSTFEMFYNNQQLQELNKLIRTFDTGITDSYISDISLEELKEKLSPSVYRKILENIKKLKEHNDFSDGFSLRSDKDFINVKMNKDDEPAVTVIKLKHENSFYDFELSEESDGTRHLFDLIDVLMTNTEDVVYIFDELERSLHPKLTEHFLRLFNDKYTGLKVQLIFTTHEASIMDQALFRHDEIWFVERDAEGSSNLYSLDRFKEKYDRKISKSYLEGRYGAVPVFKSFDGFSTVEVDENGTI